MTHDYGSTRVRPARAEDAEALAPNLRPDDLRELSATTDRPPVEVLKDGLRLSSEAYAIESASGEVIALFGAASTPEPKLGAVWLLGSTKLHTIRFTFLRHSKTWLQRLFTNYAILGNLVDERNRLHVEWLRWLGFRFLRRVPCGRNGEVFLEFVKLKE